MAASVEDTRDERRSSVPLPGRDDIEAPELAEGIRARPGEVIVPAVLGLVLWAVVCWSPLEIELAAPSVRASAVLLYTQPLVILGLSLLLRNAILAMVALPVALSVCFSALEPLDLRPLNTLGGALTLGVALTVFLVGTARWGPQRRRPPLRQATPLRAGVDRAGHRALIGQAWPRLVLLVGVLTVPLWGLYGPEGQALIEANFADRRTEALVLVHTVHLFVGVLVAYLFFLSPAINQPIELAELRERLRLLDAPDRLPIHRRSLMLWLCVGLAAAALFIWLRLAG